MQKRWIMIGLVTLLVSVNTSAAQDGIPPALLEQMSQLETITQTLRDLPAERAIDHQFPSRAETIEYLREMYSREFPPEEFDRLERFYTALDLLPADLDLQDVYLTLLGSQVAGYYDPDTRTMNVLPVVGDDPGDSLSFTEQVIYIHEFTHALQDQHFDLNALLEAPDGLENPDRSLATLALVEGDATAVMTLYVQDVANRNPLAAISLLVEGLQSGGLFLPQGIPDILVDELLFPYDAGLNFVIAISEDGGWKNVDAAYSDPPTTSEQILHPEKYLAGEAGLDVFLPDASADLGEGWALDWDTVLGEFYLREHLATHLSASLAAGAAQGWGGDRFHVYHHAETGEIAWALRTAWDSDEEYREFIEAYAIFGTTGYDDVASDASCWENETSALCVINSDAMQDNLIVSAPTLDEALALRDSLFAPA